MDERTEKILTTLAGLLNREIDTAAEDTAATFSKDSILRNPFVARLVSAGGSWVEAQGNILLKMLGNFIEFMGNKLPKTSKAATAAFGNWRTRFFEGIPERMRTAAANGTLAEEKARIETEINAMQEIENLLYPPGETPKSFDWNACFSKAKDAVHATLAEATPAVTRFADWAETLPGAKR
ncbi:MAG: hypothetical protein HYW65_01645 [Candidatus Liptonbacteria bacterium]|nr:hypothetical protein [Candidatus Liptonbacteria bacterium]